MLQQKQLREKQLTIGLRKFGPEAVGRGLVGALCGLGALVGCSWGPLDAGVVDQKHDNHYNNELDRAPVRLSFGGVSGEVRKR